VIEECRGDRYAVKDFARFAAACRMPRRSDIHSILIIGSGPIVIGQGCEFDYSGTQACKALKAEGYRIVLVNSNPATIMTDPELADATYIEPITASTVEKIIVRERDAGHKIDALLPTMGGQTALNTAMDLAKSGALVRHGVELLMLRAARQIELADGRIARVDMRQGNNLEADWYISAVPFDRLLDMLPGKVVDAQPYFSNLRNLELSPITSVHAWFDRSATSLPHVVLIDCVGQWVFNRGETAAGEFYLQVVVSAARQFRGLGRDEIERRVVAELRQMFPRLADATLLRAKVVTEHAATFSAVPGVDRWRPLQSSPLPNLLVAGDWTRTGWPATMEGAVRSGYLAAEALLERIGCPARLVQADLK